MATATYNIIAVVPKFSLASGTYKGTQSVTLTDTTPGVTIHCTTETSTPTITSPTFCTTISVSDDLGVGEHDDQGHR